MIGLSLTYESMIPQIRLRDYEFLVTFSVVVVTLALYKRFSEERMKVNQGVDVLTQLPLIIKSMLILFLSLEILQQKVF